MQNTGDVSTFFLDGKTIPFDRGPGKAAFDP
jgi:hypothetical protein